MTKCGQIREKHKKDDSGQCILVQISTHTKVFIYVPIDIYYWQTSR